MPIFQSISLVVPLYNKSERILTCLRSALDQSVAFNEIVVVDDGSTDDSAVQVLSLVANHPELQFIQQTNQGVSVARNRGWRACTSEFIAFLDADDVLRHDYREKMGTLIQTCPEAWVFCCGHSRITADLGEVFPPLGLPGDHFDYVPAYFEAASRGPIVNSSSVTLRRIALQTEGGFPEGEAVGEDLYLWARLACSSPEGRGFAFCGSRLSQIYQYPDQSRGQRIGKVSHLLTYFGSRPHLLQKRKGGKSYLWRLSYLHVLEAIRMGDRQGAQKQVHAVARAFPLLSKLLFIACILPIASLIDVVKTLRRKSWRTQRP